MNGVCAIGLELISRLRDDADLLYPYVGLHPKRKGARTKYLGKVDVRNLDESYFTCCLKEADFCLYEATSYSKSIKRKIRVVVQHEYDSNKEMMRHKIFSSTELTLDGVQIYRYYKGRYQTESLYRDAKQF